MKKRLIHWLEYNGFIGTMCSKYRFTKYVDNTIGVERLYRFRWQQLMGRLDTMLWTNDTHLTSPMRFPDVGQAKDGILVATEIAERRRRSRQVVEKYVIDADEVAQKKPETAEIPPVLKRANAKP